jgi:formate/nitrite transporter FocA (FNT family)
LPGDSSPRPDATWQARPVNASSDLFPGKHFISTVLAALDTKTEMSGALVRVYLMRSAMAGGIIGVMYLTFYAVVDAFATAGGANLVAIGRIVGAVIFGFALVFIYYSKSELLTSNMMIVTIGAYYRRVSAGRSLRILALCFLGNIIGGLAVALLVWGSSLADGNIGALMNASMDHKLAFITEGASGWLDLFIRAVLCNFMINLAMLLVYNGLIKDDLTKSLVMIMSVFIFAFVGFEHSVANTVLFTIVGLHDGIDAGLAAANVGIVLLGNFVGGGLLIGWYYAYANDDRRHVLRNGRGSN